MNKATILSLITTLLFLLLQPPMEVSAAAPNILWKLSDSEYFLFDEDYDSNANYGSDNWMDAVYALINHFNQYSESNNDNLYNFLSANGVKKMSDWYTEKGGMGATTDEYIEYVYRTLYAKYGNNSRNDIYIRNDKIYESSITGGAGSEINEALGQISNLVNGIANGFLGIGVFTCIIVFLIQLIRIGVMPTHPIQRRKTLLDFGTCIICIVLLGSIRLLVFLGYYIVLT